MPVPQAESLCTLSDPCRDGLGASSARKGKHRHLESDRNIRLHRSDDRHEIDLSLPWRQAFRAAGAKKFLCRVRRMDRRVAQVQEGQTGARLGGKVP